MSHIRLFTAIMAFLLGSALSGTFAGDSVQEQAAAVSPDENRTVKQAESAALSSRGGKRQLEKKRHDISCLSGRYLHAMARREY